MKRLAMLPLLVLPLAACGGGTTAAKTTSATTVPTSTTATPSSSTASFTSSSTAAASSTTSASTSAASSSTSSSGRASANTSAHLDPSAASAAVESVLSSHVKSELAGTYFASLAPKELTTQATNICADFKGGASIQGELARKILQYHPATATQVGDFIGLSIGTHCPQFIGEAQRAAS